MNICCVFVGDIFFEIKTEADSNDIAQYARDNMPSTGMIVIQYSLRLYFVYHFFFDVYVILLHVSE